MSPPDDCGSSLEPLAQPIGLTGLLPVADLLVGHDLEAVHRRLAELDLHLAQLVTTEDREGTDLAGLARGQPLTERAVAAVAIQGHQLVAGIEPGLLGRSAG